MNISDFARAGQISIRMLRHYDKIGLLAPAHVDARTGHRTYKPEQLPHLHRLLALKTMGFSLAEVGELLQAGISAGRLRTLLQHRRSELEVQVRTDRHRLARVEARLSLLEEKPLMKDHITITDVTRTHLAALTEHHPGPDRRAAGGLIQPLFIRATQAADDAGITRIAPIGYYPVNDDGVRLVAGFEAGEDAASAQAGLEIIEIPGARVATLLHVGEMSDIGATYAELDRWASEQGAAGPYTWREVYLEADGIDQSDWVVQVQLELPSPDASPPAKRRRRDDPPAP